MNFFDRFLDAFSAKDLKRRVNGVMAFGMLICLVSAICGHLFFTKNFTASIEATKIDDGAFMNDDGSLSIKVSIDHGDIDRLPQDGVVEIEEVPPAERLTRQEVAIRSIDPANGVVTLAYSATDMVSVPLKSGQGLKIITADAPLWKLLFNR